MSIPPLDSAAHTPRTRTSSRGSDKLTDSEIKSALRRARTSGVKKLFDGRGLYLLINSDSAQQGNGYWRFKYRIDGTEKLISLGIYPQTSLRVARKKRDDERALVDQGRDPSVERQAAKAARKGQLANTLREVTLEWFEKKSRAWAPSNSRRILRRLENDVFPFLGDHPIAKVTAREVLDTLRRVEARGAVESAHRIRHYLNLAFRYAVSTERMSANPIPDASVLATPIRGHFASITEPKGVGALMRAIRGYRGTFVTRVALQLAPLVFVRPGELRAAAWSEFDLDAAVWCIPAKRMKMREKHVVPLSRQAVNLLRELHCVTGSGDLVFPSERGKKRSMSENTLNSALRALGYSKDQMTSHGFRHMASTLLNESQKWHPDAIERQLAHKERNEIRGAYNQAEHMPDRYRMMQWWANHLDGLAESAPIDQAQGALPRARTGSKSAAM